MEFPQFIKYFCPGCREELDEGDAHGFNGYFLHSNKMEEGCGYSGNQSNVIQAFDVKAAEQYVKNTSSDLREKINDLEKNFINEGLKDRVPLENFLKK